MGWVYLAGAIVCEIVATLSLRMAVRGRWTWYIPVAIGYPIAFVLLSFTLATGVPLGVAYGIWAATGVALTALLSRVLFGEPLTRLMLVGIGLIVIGVLAIELGSSHA